MKKKHRLLSVFLALSLCVGLLPTSALAVSEEPAGVWKVGTNAELNDAVKEIEQKRDNDGLTKATIALTADITLEKLNPNDTDAQYCGDNYFAGIKDVELTLTSDGKAEGEAGYKLTNFGLRVTNYATNAKFGNNSGEKPRFIIGPIIFDQIDLVSDHMWLFAQGHHVVFTKNFRNSYEYARSSSSNNDYGAINVVGGMLGTQYRQMGTGFESGTATGKNSAGTPSALKTFPPDGKKSQTSIHTEEFGWVPAHTAAFTDTNIEIYGGYFGTIVGGNYNSSMMGDTHVTVALDPDKTYDFTNRHNCGGIIGGNVLSTSESNSPVDKTAVVYGDTHVNALSGTFGTIYGGSMANFAANSNDNMGQIWGDTYVTVGQESGMEARFSDVYGGGNRSTIGQKVRLQDAEGWYTNFACFGGNTHVTVNNTAAGEQKYDDQTSSHIYGGGDMDLIWGTTEVILNGGSNADWVFAGGSNSTYNKKARILNMIPEGGKTTTPETAAHIVVNGGTWDEIYSCACTFAGSNDADNTQWIRGDVVVDFNGGKVNSFCLSGPRTAIGLGQSDYVSDYWIKDEQYTAQAIGNMPTEADSILNVNGGEFRQEGLVNDWNTSIRGYRYSNWWGNTDQYGKVTGKRNVNFYNDEPMTVYGMESVDNTSLNSGSKVSVDSYDFKYNGQSYYTRSLKWCTNVNIATDAELALADGAYILGNLNIAQDGILALPVKSSSETFGQLSDENAALNCKGTATGVAGGLRTVNQVAKQTTDGYLWETGSELRPLEGQVYVRSNNLGTGTETSNTPNADSLMLDLVNNEPDLYVEYTKDADALKYSDSESFQHAWRIAKDSTVQTVTVKYWSHKDNSESWVLNNEQTAALNKTVGTLPADPTRTGYQFNGWTLTEDGSGNAFTAQTTITQEMVKDGVVNVYGQWLPIITFDANGGSWDANVTTKDVTAGTDGKVAAPDSPAQTNKVFDGWYTAATDGGKLDLTTKTFDKPTTLYAHWKDPEPEKVTISYSEQGKPEGVTLPENATVNKGTAYTSESPSITNGWRFEGWYTDASLNTPYVDGTAVNENLTLYGKWIQTFTVTYTDGVDGEDVFADQTTTVDVGAATPIFDGTPSRPGYTFKGWSPVVAETVTADAVYTAVWEKNPTGGGGGGSVTTKYTLTYESNGGTEYQDERYARNTTVELDKVPAREGYQFTGWYADEELTQKISEIKMTSDKTVYAGWQASAVPDMLNGKDHFAYVVGYPDGSVGPKDNITRAETATIFFRLLKDEVRDGNLTYTSAFEDVESGAWYSTPVCTMAELGIVKGRTETTFAPTAPITRAEFAAICARFDTGLTDGDSNFTDIDGHWAKDEIERAATLGWVQGDPDGRFRPNAYITRAEAMTMINRVLCRIPETESDLLNGMNVWPDNQPGVWYYLAVQEATNSHDFERKGEVFEKWTVLTEDPDWTRYEQ